ncbi:oligosaccharide flippase family protein [uncultured Fibrobacter sp.]|uniref:oligosaccharide flippase family protein n=1 Tax=uncultured Fibrobacter sp. TaxID=261512 RepID=UPI002611547C|nr:oligosaccharide flippase family protein [uncultured Fibrobacter sp.]
MARQNAMSSSIQNDQKFLVKSTLFTIVGTVLKVVAPVLMIVVARIFGKEIFGIYISTQLFVLTLCRVAVLGLDKGLHRYLPQNKVQGRPAHEGLVESFWVAVTIALGFSLLIWFGSFFNLQRVSSGLAMLSSLEISLYGLSVLPYTMLNMFAGASEGNRHPQYKIFINDFAVMTLAPLIAIVLHFCGFNDKLALPTGFFVANILGVVSYFVLINRQFPQIRWFIKKRVPREMLDFSLPLGFSEVVSTFLLRVDLWMVLALLGPEAAGVYAVMVTISNGLKTIRQSYNPILQPVVAGMSRDRLGSDLKPVYSYCVSMVTLIQLAIGYFIVLFPEQTMMIAGKSFVTGNNPVAVLGILIIGNLVNGFFGLSGAIINGLGKSRFMLLMNAVSLVLAIALNRLLIPVLGIAGAAVSSMAYQVVQCIWMNLYLKKMGYWPYKKALWIQGLWIVSLVAVDYVVNFVYEPNLCVKGAFYVGIAGLLALTFWLQGLSAKKSTDL